MLDYRARACGRGGAQLLLARCSPCLELLEEMLANVIRVLSSPCRLFSLFDSLCLLQAFLSHAQCCRMAAELRTTVCSTMSLKSIEPRTLISLPTELLTLVAEELDLHGLARFADACKGCLAAAHGELRAALRTAVRLCLEPGAGPVSDARTSRQGEGAARGTGKRRHQLL